jgi:hypothetical protein
MNNVILGFLITIRLLSRPLKELTTTSFHPKNPGECAAKLRMTENHVSDFLKERRYANML